MAGKAVISLTTGLEDTEKATIAFLVAVGAAETGRPTLMFLTKEAVRLALDGVAAGVGCDGCPPLPDLMKRYEAAGELIGALRQRIPSPAPTGRVKSLTGLRLSFTGFLSRPRSEAILAAKKAGAIVQSKPGQMTDVLVRGRPNVLQVAGTVGGTKLMEIRRLAAQGHAVTVIGDKQFWRLVGTSSTRTSKLNAKRTS